MQFTRLLVEEVQHTVGGLVDGVDRQADDQAEEPVQIQSARERPTDAVEGLAAAHPRAQLLGHARTLAETRHQATD